MGFIISRFFYRGADENSLTVNETVILQIKQCRDKIKNFIKKLQKDSDLNREKAKEMLKKNEREKAKVFLNKSKVCSGYIDNYQNQLNIIEDQINTIQMQKQNKETMDVLLQGNSVLRELQKEVNLERLENISEEMNEIKQSQEEVTSFLKNYKIDEKEFDAEIDKELQNLMNDFASTSDKNLIGKQLETNLKEHSVLKINQAKREEKIILMN